LPVRELEIALEFLEFLRERRPLPRPRVRTMDTTTGDEASKDQED
jgi:hypothetical protein